MLNFFSVVLNDLSYKQCAALLCLCFLFCSSLSVENVQIFYRICSAKLSFNSFTVIPMEVSYMRSSALVFAGFLYRSSLNTESFREFWKTTLANLMLIFSLWFSLMFPINNLLLCFSPASFSGSSLILESVQIFYRICSANLSSKSFTIVLMEDSYRHSNALVFAGLVYCSSLNVETLWYFKKTTLANVMLTFSLWCLMMSPINYVLLCFARASYFVQVCHENVQIFYRICSAKLSFNSFTVVSMEVSYKRSAALLSACFLYCSSLKIETLREFRKTTLANVMLNFFFVVLNDVSYKQCAALLWSCFLFCSSLSVENVQIFYRICSAKLSFNSFTVVSMEVSYKRSSALVFAGFLYRSSLNIKSFREFWKTTLANLMLKFSLWLSLMSPINNVLLCFARASFFVQVSVLKMFKSSIEYALQNSVSNHSRLFWWMSPISAALLWFSLASYNVQVSILKLFESFGWLHLQMWCWIFLCGSHWCFLYTMCCYALLVLPMLFKSQSWESSNVR